MFWRKQNSEQRKWVSQRADQPGLELRVESRHWVRTEWPSKLELAGRTVIRQMVCLEPRHQPAEQSENLRSRFQQESGHQLISRNLEAEQTRKSTEPGTGPRKGPEPCNRESASWGVLQSRLKSPNTTGWRFAGWA